MADAVLQNPSLLGLAPIVEFKAGKLNWDQTSKKVTPDLRKGKVVLVKDHDDMHHVQWFDREKNTVIDDIVAIGDTYLERVEKCATGRVYILKNTDSNRREFYWMQEPKDDKDAELIKKFNDTIGATIPPPKAPSTAAMPAMARPGGATSSSAGPAGQMSQEQMQAQLMAMLQGNFQQMQAAGAVPPPAGPKTGLHHILSIPNLRTLLEDPEAVSELVGHLPTGQQSETKLDENMICEQLPTNMKLLTQAIYSDAFQSLCSMLQVQPEAGVSDPMEALCKALERKHGSK